MTHAAHAVLDLRQLRLTPGKKRPHAFRLSAHGVRNIGIAIQKGFPREPVDGRKLIGPHIAEFLRGKDFMGAFVKLRSDGAEQAEKLVSTQFCLTQAVPQA